MAELLNFAYTKKNGETREVKLYQLVDKPDQIEGIDIERLDENQSRILLDALLSMDAAIDYCMSGYRAFKKDAIVDGAIESEEVV